MIWSDHWMKHQLRKKEMPCWNTMFGRIIYLLLCAIGMAVCYLIVSNLTSMTGIRYCPKCECIKPDRAHHCSLCGHCVLKFDHHCPLVISCFSFAIILGG